MQELSIYIVYNICFIEVQQLYCIHTLRMQFVVLQNISFELCFRLNFIVQECSIVFWDILEAAFSNQVKIILRIIFIIIIQYSIVSFNSIYTLYVNWYVLSIFTYNIENFQLCILPVITILSLFVRIEMLYCLLSFFKISIMLYLGNVR